MFFPSRFILKLLFRPRSFGPGFFSCWESQSRVRLVVVVDVVVVDVVVVVVVDSRERRHPEIKQGSESRRSSGKFRQKSFSLSLKVVFIFLFQLRTKFCFAGRKTHWSDSCKMCTVLQQHLNRVANGYGTLNSSDSYDHPRGRSTTPGGNIYHQNRTLSPVRFTPTPIYSYLQDSLTLKVKLSSWFIEWDMKFIFNKFVNSHS